LIAYWFAVRFGKGPAEIGPLMAGGFLMAAIASVATGSMTRWFGMVRAVVVMRIVGLALLIALPLSPSFGLAASLYMLRTMFNRRTTGARSAPNMCPELRQDNVLTSWLAAILASGGVFASMHR
jgi:hypothetical protein